MESSNSQYKIVFNGELKPGSDREALIPPLCKFLNIPTSKGHLLFSGKPLALRKGLDHDKALKIYNALDKLGLITRLISEEKITDEISSQQESRVSADTLRSVTPKTCPHCGKALTDSPQQEGAETKQSENRSFDVKPKWQQIFELFDKLNGRTQSYTKIVRSDAYKDLSIGQKVKINFSFLGFLFGPFYYFYHRLWAKSFFILSICLVTLSLINLMSGIIKPVVFDTINLLLTSIVFGQFAKYDYYRLKVNNETFYPELPNWLRNPIVLTVLFLISLALVAITDPLFEPERELLFGSTQQISQDKASDLTQPDIQKATSPIETEIPPDNSARFESYESLAKYSASKYGKKDGQLVYAVN